MENVAVLDRLHRHIPVRAGERGNTRDVRPLCKRAFLHHTSQRSQTALFALPGIEVQLSILTAVEQMLLINRISR